MKHLNFQIEISIIIYINLLNILKTINMENKLLMIKHPERGIWYFTNMQKAANWIGIQRTTLLQCFGKRKLEYKGYTIEWIDGSDVLYKYINPEK